MSTPETRPSKMMWWIACFAAAVTALAWLAHFSAPGDMHDDDQLKPAAYTLDILQHGSWAVQTDFEGNIASKPPLYPWLAAATARLHNSPGTDFDLYLPCGLLLLFAALATASITTRTVSATAGAFAALAFVLNPLTAKHLCLARPDAVFTGCVTLSAWSLLQSLLHRRNGLRAAARWATLLFWLFAAGATLTKGPLGLLLASGGALALYWPDAAKHGTSSPRNSLWPAHLLGFLGFAAFTGGWFAWAVYSGGQPVIDRMIGRELVGHTLGSHSSPPPFSRVYLPSFYLLARYLPWSPLLVVALIRLLRRPSTDLTTRFTERFAFCWLVVGLIVFSIPGHQRADLLLPLLPAAALLVGQQVDRLLQRANARPRTTPILIASIAVIGLAGIAWWNHRGRLADNDVVISHQADALAAKVRATDPSRPLAFDRSAWDMQWAFRTHQPVIDGPNEASRPCWFITRTPIADQSGFASGSTNWGDTPGEILIYKFD